MSVEITCAVKRFDGVAALDGVSVAIPRGAFFVALGPSGCGKSTLLRLIAGLETLDNGEIALDGRPVAGPGLHVAPEDRTVGVVFQSYALWPHMSVRENVAFPAETAGARRAEAAREADAHLRSVGLEALGARRPAELSGGQRQRVALARCLASRARTVLMDEPLANLDPHLRAAMEEELRAFHRRADLTTLYITHDQREAMALADRVAVMRAGRFEQVAPPEEVYARPATEHVARFIGRAALARGALESAHGGRAAARIGPLEAVVACGPDAPAGAARIVLRPEDVVLDPEGAPGRLVSARYRGGIWEGEAALDGLVEPLPIAARARLNVGETVRLRLTGGWALPG
ncbi:MAG: ABC transporter ATP-binding protein [Rubrimonas sp.]|uniref:ABC transporter ATP-binding protein n=1 Tax=Rubrimonas sp. TaxID=2036015 RepID=UPI002FDEE36A